MPVSGSSMPYASAAHGWWHPLPTYDVPYSFASPYPTTSVSSAAASTATTSYATSTPADSSHRTIPAPAPQLTIPAPLDIDHSHTILRAPDDCYLYGYGSSLESIPPCPHSSPSAFSPVTPGGSRASDHFVWPIMAATVALDEATATTTTTDPKPPVLASSARMGNDALSPDLGTLKSNRPYALLAPHPLGVRRLALPTKRCHDDTADALERKRRRSIASSAGGPSPDISEEDRLLLRLKDEDGLAWKDIATRFQTDLGKTYQIPALQMRLKRLKERLRVWTDADVKALRMAHDYWKEQKFDIIALKMMEFGASDRWSPKQCAGKWAEIYPGATPFATRQGATRPAVAPFSYTASPESGSYLSYMQVS